MKRLVLTFISFAISMLAITSIISPATYAVDLFEGCKTTGVNCDTVKTNVNLKSRAWNIVSTALVALGGIAVVVIIIGGIMYATSNGDSGKVTAAKNTIMYAVVGVVVAFLAVAIVNLANTYLK